MSRKENDCSPETDELIKEFCRENDVGSMKGCPKCGMSGNDLMITIFCEHHYCPFRDYRNAS